MLRRGSKRRRGTDGLPTGRRDVAGKRARHSVPLKGEVATITAWIEVHETLDLGLHRVTASSPGDTRSERRGMRLSAVREKNCLTSRKIRHLHHSTCHRSCRRCLETVLGEGSKRKRKCLTAPCHSVLLRCGYSVHPILFQRHLPFLIN